jgi:hypothetical protein
MKIGPNRALASLVREGDYLVFRAEKGGILVEYSPGSAPGSPIIGAFVAKNGQAKYFDAQEAANLIDNFQMAAEDHLLTLADTTPNHKEKTLAEKIVDAIKVYADGGYRTTVENPVWDGPLNEFYSEVVYPYTGIPFTGATLKALYKIPSMVPGVSLGKIGKTHFITVHWGRVEPEA